jgi:hypothetical protein
MPLLDNAVVGWAHTHTPATQGPASAEVSEDSLARHTVSPWWPPKIPGAKGVEVAVLGCAQGGEVGGV